MKIEKATWYRCPECETLHETEDEAHECCPRDIESVPGFVCGECGEFYEDREQAKECCK